MKKIPFLLQALPLLLVTLLYGSLAASSPATGSNPPIAVTADACELPPPDTVWVVSTTSGSIKISWTPVTGAYSYYASVVNLDGGSAPPPQTILAPTTEATFAVGPGKYKFEVKTTGCDGGSYGAGRTVIASTAIIITDVILEFCTPNSPQLLPPSDVTVCLPYGSSPDVSAPMRAVQMSGKWKKPGQAAINWKVEFNLLMPCPGSWAYDVVEDSTNNVYVTGVINPNGSYSELSFNVGGYFGPTIFKIDNLSWCASYPATNCSANNNNGCGNGYGSCVIDFLGTSGITIDAFKSNGPFTDFSGCMGRAPYFGWCINNPAMVKAPVELDEFSQTAGSSGGDNTGLLRVAPNPFTNGTTISFDLPQDTPLRLTLYDAMGRPVKTLEQSDLALAGAYHSELEAKELAPGVYFLVLQTAQERRITTLVKSE